jgi:SNF2 family DNA or RNA helicase
MPVAELDENGEQIVLHDTLWADKPLVTQIPGKKWDANLKRWTLPLSWAACIQARALFGPYDPETGKGLRVGELLGGWSRGEKARRDAVLKLRDAREPVNVYAYDVDNDHADKLYPFQIPGRDFMVTAKYALLGDEMGSGKTLQTLAALRAVNKQDSRDVWGTGDESGMGYVEQGAYPALVVCPNSTKRNWAREIRKWLPEATPVVIDGSAAKRRKQLEAVYEDGRPAIRNAVVIMNIESVKLHSRLAPYGSVRLKKCAECDPTSGNAELTPAKCESHDKELNAIPFKVCVLDEAHRVKDPRTLQARAVWRVFHGETVTYRWALTGTPVANHPGDIWSILHTIAPHEFPRKSAFIDRYALVEFNAFGGMSIVGLNPATRDEFLSLLDVRFRRMLKALVLDQLPAKTRVVRHVEMSAKQAKAYKEVADEYVLTTESGDKLVMNGNLPAATRLLQLSSAMCDIDKGETPDDMGSWKVTLTDTPKSPKIDELMSIIEDNPDKPLAIAAEHKQLIDLAARRLTAEGIEYGVITGGVSGAQRDETIEAFQSGKLKYILFTYKAGGVGLNMTAADTLVRLQRSWSLIDNMQGEDRVHRIGSEKHKAITIIDIITADTVEETQVEKLYAKMQRLEEIVRDREQLQTAGKSTAHLDAEAARIESLDLLDIDEELTKYEDAMNDDIDGGP